MGNWKHVVLFVTVFLDLNLHKPGSWSQDRNFQPVFCRAASTEDVSPSVLLEDLSPNGSHTDETTRSSENENSRENPKSHQKFKSVEESRSVTGKVALPNWRSAPAAQHPGEKEPLPGPLSRPEAQAEVEGGHVVEAHVAVYTCVMLLILVFCVLLIVVLFRTKNLRGNTSSLYLLSFLLGRLLIGVLVIPLRITSLYLTTSVGSSLCKTWSFFYILSCHGSAYSLVVLAAFQYRAFNRNFPPSSSSWQPACIHVTITWLIAALNAARFPLLNSLVPVEQGDLCAVQERYSSAAPYLTIFDLIILVFLPTILTLFFTLTIRHKLSRQVSDTHTQLAMSAKLQLRALSSLIVVYAICTAGPLVLDLFLHFRSRDNPIPEVLTVEHALYVISYSHCWLSAIILVCFGEDFRKGLKELCCKKKERSRISLALADYPSSMTVISTR